MQQEIERALQVLIGLPLWGAGRTSILEWFQFGERRALPRDDGGERVAGTYTLHVQCAWRLGGPTGILVGSFDRYLAAGPDPFKDYATLDWDRPGANRCDERMDALFEALGDDLPVVEAVRADYAGGFRLLLSGGLALDAFPDHSLEGEYWRLFQPGTEEGHFAVTGMGVEAEAAE